MPKTLVCIILQTSKPTRSNSPTCPVMKSKKKVVIQIETLEADTVLHYLSFLFFSKKKCSPSFMFTQLIISKYKLESQWHTWKDMNILTVTLLYHHDLSCTAAAVGKLRQYRYYFYLVLFHTFPSNLVTGMQFTNQSSSKLFPRSQTSHTVPLSWHALARSIA